MGTGFLAATEVEFEFQEPVPTAEQLTRVVDGMQELTGVARVRSDGMHISVHYDDALVHAARLRSRLRELGHPAKAGTEVQPPGVAAD